MYVTLRDLSAVSLNDVAKLAETVIITNGTGAYIKFYNG